jgi:hypothetical protein
MLDKQETVERIRKAIECTTSLVAREKHGEHGHHFHRFHIRFVYPGIVITIKNI